MNEDETRKMVEHISEVMYDMGSDQNMERDRPYTGQPHTDTGERGKQEIYGITMRDLRDCFIRAFCLSADPDIPHNLYAIQEADKGPEAALCENDVYELQGDIDPIAVGQNLACEVERIMGIFPNIPNWKHKGNDNE